jgi:hypothetical protein
VDSKISNGGTVMSTYTVVGFTIQDIKKYKEREFLDKPHDAIGKSDVKLFSNPAGASGVEIVEVFSHEKFPTSRPLPGFNAYSTVYFLNEPAVRMCKQIRLTLNVLKIIPAEELPEGLVPEFQKPYIF